MNPETNFKRLFERYPALEGCRDSIWTTFKLLSKTIECDGLILVCGNGGSAADADHIVGELMKGFESKRPIQEDEARLFAQYGELASQMAKHLQSAIRAISLASHSALMTAYSNDCEPDFVFAQQVWGYGREGDSLICISTSGNSSNVVQAAISGKIRGLNVIGLTGSSGGRLFEIADEVIRVPAVRTSEVQEYHLPIYHTLCLMLESAYFPDWGR